MLRTVNFDNQALVEINKIEDVAIDWCLPAKVVSLPVEMLELKPELYFFMGHGFAELLGFDFDIHGGPLRR